MGHGGAGLVVRVAEGDKIADEDDPYVAGMEGISSLCEDLGIDPLEDMRILVLLWKMGIKDKPAQNQAG